MAALPDSLRGPRRGGSLSAADTVRIDDKELDEIAVVVRNALAAENLSAFTQLLDPPVTWGAPGARNPSCKNPTRSWPGSVYDAEVLGEGGLTRADVFRLLEEADNLIVELESRIDTGCLIAAFPLPTRPPEEVRTGLTWLIGTYGRSREHVGQVQITTQLRSGRDRGRPVGPA